MCAYVYTYTHIYTGTYIYEIIIKEKQAINLKGWEERGKGYKEKIGEMIITF